ncbi:MAG: hypothetical protein IH993_01030 [Proteobacteria bacterium]|nr:hypothetical protein [Pseudomonadota bacterium]
MGQKEDNKKWISLIAKLLQLTQSGKIQWKAVSPAKENLPADERIALVYEADYLEQGLRIYEFEYKSWVDEDRFEWSNGIKLEFTDRLGRSLYSVSDILGLWDLLRAIKYKSANIDAFLEKLGVA